MDPTVSQLVANIQLHGSLNLFTNNVINLFANQMGTVCNTIANSMAKVTQMIDLQTNMLTYLQNPDLGSAVHGLQENVLSSAIGDIQSSTAAFDLLGTIVGQANPSFAHLANTITTVGQTATTVANAVSTVMGMADLGGAVFRMHGRSRRSHGYCRSFRR